MVGLHPKKHITCPKCYFEYDSVIGNNSLYICPKCNGYAGKVIGAVRMYENAGFRTVDENDEEYIMVCELK